nr:FctA domain-containing protein [Bifidobacterium sp. DSM 109957]
MTVTQNYEEHEVDSSKKQNLVSGDLGQVDLSALFSGTTTVQVRNRANKSNVKVPLKVKKIVEGGDWAVGDEFTFKLTADPAQATASNGQKVTAPLPIGDGVECDSDEAADAERSCTVTVTRPESGTEDEVSFGEITFTTRLFQRTGWPEDADKNGTPLEFTYTISEVKPAEGAVDGMTYSEARYTLKVVVTRDWVSGKGSNALTVRVTLIRNTDDGGVSVDGGKGELMFDSQWGFDADETDPAVAVAEFTNSFGFPVSSLPFTGGATGRQWLLWGLALAGASVLAWLAYNEWCKRHGLPFSMM